MPELSKQPVRLRPVTDQFIGTTAFFRNRRLLATLFDQLKEQGKSSYKVLIHACSIGAEVYSMLIFHKVQGYDRYFSLECVATDIEAGFIEYARQATYPVGIAKGLSDQELQYFSLEGENISVNIESLNEVEYIEPCSFVDFMSSQPFDLVFVLNAFIYVTAAQQHTAIKNIAAYNTAWLVTSAFHMQTIKGDLDQAGYIPYTHNQQEIHDAWLDRRIDEPGYDRSSEVREGIFTPWSLPFFQEIEDYQYKYCAIFKKALNE
ncbi:MAG: CheR family methyltransferase [bacterium]